MAKGMVNQFIVVVVHGKLGQKTRRFFAMDLQSTTVIYATKKFAPMKRRRAFRYKTRFVLDGNFADDVNSG
jgi:hypothetical protein